MFCLKCDVQANACTGLEAALKEVCVVLCHISTEVDFESFVFVDVLGNSQAAAFLGSDYIETPPASKPGIAFGSHHLPSHGRLYLAARGEYPCFGRKA